MTIFFFFLTTNTLKVQFNEIIYGIIVVVLFKVQGGRVGNAIYGFNAASVLGIPSDDVTAAPSDNNFLSNSYRRYQFHWIECQRRRIPSEWRMLRKTKWRRTIYFATKNGLLMIGNKSVAQ